MLPRNEPKAGKRMRLEPPETRPVVILRDPIPGDLGWVIHRQAVIYTSEYGWDNSFEALVADIAARFIREFDPTRERCWIAERDGAVIGSIFLVHDTDETAKLRMLYVDAEARGLGVGRTLVTACIDHARACCYRRLRLWTFDILTAAARIYQQAGFQLIEETPEHSFGHDLTAQIWELAL